MQELEDRIAVGFSRAITRSNFLSRAMRLVLVAGTATGGALFFAKSASAGTCSPGATAPAQPHVPGVPRTILTQGSDGAATIGQALPTAGAP